MRQLPPYRPLPVATPTHRPHPTHEAIITYRAAALQPQQLLGRITFCMASSADNQRLARLIAYLQWRMGTQVQYTVAQLAIHREAVRLSNLERMRRKWRRVVAAFEADRQAILQGQQGMFQEESLRQLESLLHQARTKVEATYGHTIDQLHDTHLIHRTQQLTAMGLINTTTYVNSH